MEDVLSAEAEAEASRREAASGTTSSSSLFNMFGMFMGSQASDRELMEEVYNIWGKHDTPEKLAKRTAEFHRFREQLLAVNVKPRIEEGRTAAMTKRLAERKARTMQRRGEVVEAEALAVVACFNAVETTGRDESSGDPAASKVCNLNATSMRSWAALNAQVTEALE